MQRPPTLVATLVDLTRAVRESAAARECAERDGVPPDEYARTVVFGLVLAVAEGADRHLTDGRSADPLLAATITPILRVLRAIDWAALTAADPDLHVHLYEQFLRVDAPGLRRSSGTYYTPVPLADTMVRLTDQLLRTHFDTPGGLGDDAVRIVDPAMGTGTFPLAILRLIGAANAGRLHGAELHSGPFTVAEFRIRAHAQGPNLFRANTLDDPDCWLALADERAEQPPVRVVLGNPPYRERARGLGGWIENGTDPATGRPPLDAFRLQANGSTEFALSNSYIHFWRWASWWAFDASHVEQPRTEQARSDRTGPGLICFLTATGYLTGPGFRGMREYLRRRASHGWIINLSPEGKKPPPRNAVFAIETPVCIGIFARTTATDDDIPADMHYLDLHGTSAEKLADLDTLTFDDRRWRPVRTQWHSPFTPAAASGWDSFPEVATLMPWLSTGVTPNRNWVSAPSATTLDRRLRTLLDEHDADRRSVLFKTTDSRSPDRRGVRPLPGVPHDTAPPLDATDSDDHRGHPVPVERIMFRAFDRQWLIADNRLLDRARPDLWAARRPGQLFVVEQHSIHPGAGPALYFSALLPDINAFNNRGGRTLPRLHPDGTPNVAPGLDHALRTLVGASARAEDLVFYLAALTAHPGFVAHFDDELATPGVRIPITGDSALWDTAVELGRRVVGLMTYSPDAVIELAAPGAPPPEQTVPVGDLRPTMFSHDALTQTLVVGSGRWEHVPRAILDYRVGGIGVVSSWVKYRLARPVGKVSSPLDEVQDAAWPEQWSDELTEVLRTIAALIALHDDMDHLLREILAGPLVSEAELTAAGMTAPTSALDRKPRR
ncbi:N-6 DNA methylase [Gordonia polyisoprenivorans]|nr:DNA methylase [Gordonia polyisoprenivorans]QUD82872.1 N-6 DNA methylase [Gordonia polyisoprenivorans]